MHKRLVGHEMSARACEAGWCAPASQTHGLGSGPGTVQLSREEGHARRRGGGEGARGAWARRARTRRGPGCSSRARRRCRRCAPRGSARPGIGPGSSPASFVGRGWFRVPVWEPANFASACPHMNVRDAAKRAEICASPQRSPVRRAPTARGTGAGPARLAHEAPRRPPARSCAMGSAAQPGSARVAQNNAGTASNASPAAIQKNAA